MRTMEVKTADLIGPALDWAVAATSGVPLEFVDGKCFVPWGNAIPGCAKNGATHWSPSTNWSQGGPLIDKHRFEFEWVDSDWHGEPLQFFTACGCDMPADATSAGPTHLIAACRAIVRAKLGNTVQIPAELA
ncbi:phage protein NinX family protein [Pseudomonas sp.]|uniref:phage protein NinX family protein n=1 Tax=Pseudomonas sp. TaxID=306 RepID=UPI0031CE9DD5